MNIETVRKKRIIWKKDDLVSIYLSNGSYTIAQMLDSPIMCFYNIVNNNGIWENIDLKKIETLFIVFVNNSINKDFIIGKLNNKNIPIKEFNKYYFIKPYTIMDGLHYKGTKNNFPFLGGKLINYNHKIGSVRSPIIKEDLTLPNDKEIIEKYELTNMWGKQELEERLIRYFSIGINRDDLKYEVFPNLWNKEKDKPLTSRLPELLR
jgi:hypothetical protein